MEKISLRRKWLAEMLPEGFPLKTSTLVSGPGGSGKPLVGYIFASEFLENGGNMILILTSTTRDYVINVMKIFDCNLTKMDDRIFYVEFQPGIEKIEEINKNWIKADILKPETWDEIIERGVDMLGKNTIVVASALNLLFFSKTYAEPIYKKLVDILKEDKSLTYFFTINSDAFRDKAKKMEESCDNLMLSRMEKGKLHLKIERMKGVEFVKEEKEIPLSKETLEEIRQEAEKGKKNLIPAISAI